MDLHLSSCPLFNSPDLLVLLKATSLCLLRYTRTSRVMPAPLRSDSHIFGIPSMSFRFCKTQIFSFVSSAQWMGPPVISRGSSVSLFLLTFNICWTNVLYVLSVERVWFLYSWLDPDWYTVFIGSHLTPSSKMNIVFSQRKQNSLIKHILSTLQTSGTELSARDT